jgi:hypothetical protein
MQGESRTVALAIFLCHPAFLARFAIVTDVIKHAFFSAQLALNNAVRIIFV